MAPVGDPGPVDIVAAFTGHADRLRADDAGGVPRHDVRIVHAAVRNVGQDQAGTGPTPESPGPG